MAGTLTLLESAGVAIVFLRLLESLRTDTRAESRAALSAIHNVGMFAELKLQPAFAELPQPA